MEPNRVKSTSEKLANAMIIGLVVMGTVIFSVINQASSGAELMPTFFMLFLGAIITIQVVPSLMLLAKIVKGACSAGQKKEPARTNTLK